MNKDSKLYVAGHTGLVGSAIMRKLEIEGYQNVVTARSEELDLRDQQQVDAFFEHEKPEYVFLAAAKVGGIMANSTYPAEFIYDNLMIATNVIHAAYKYGVKKLLNLGSSCIYPKNAPQPLKEEYLLTAPLEPTNEPYAIAKISAIKLCQSYNRQYGTNFISAMPTNLYGPGDNFDLETSHVLPAMIRKFHEAKVNNAQKVTLWGTGAPRREFLYSDDLADALLFLMHKFDATGEVDFVNVGTGEDISIKDLAELVREAVGYEGQVGWDTSKPDGAMRKMLNVGKLFQIGWEYKTSFIFNINHVYKWYLECMY
ncbi:MAG: GDP-L-fucose synthase [Deferribacteres bacterium]|nr:GDP-L-fucose synthase [Deferribacteres bacterium]